jgi:ABC-type multidrug transport system fused ATPase/permease subunit
MPSLQFKAIKALAKKMNIVILNEETISLDNSVSGLIEVSIDNE